MASKFAHAQGNAFLKCPYNPEHRITNSQLESHLAICRKRFRKQEKEAGRKCEMLVCRFNPCHRFLEPELKWHEDICPDGNGKDEGTFVKKDDQNLAENWEVEESPSQLDHDQEKAKEVAKTNLNLAIGVEPSNAIGGDGGMKTGSTNAKAQLKEWPWKDDPSDFHPDDNDDFEGYDPYEKNENF